MTVSRRRFLQLGTLASASLLVPKFLSSFSEYRIPSAKKLIVIQLSGGNDGLNTVIPCRNDIYYRSRPLLGITRAKALRLTDDAGLHPSLQGLRALYDEGSVSILNSVGYPDQSRSHFRAMDICHSASTDNTETGWLGRYLDHLSQDSRGVELDETVSLAMTGYKTSGYAFGNFTHQQEHHARLADYLTLTSTSAAASADYQFQQARGHVNATEYPNTAVGMRMKVVSSILKSDNDTHVFYASHGSFDTHVDQPGHHSNLLRELDDSLSALVADLRKDHLFDDTMIVVFSEFGRRVFENDSNGTDHGAANNMFIISGGLKSAGIYNPLPDLTDLDDGDIRYTIDFREVYATVLNKWMNTDSASILGGRYMQHKFI